MSEKFPSQTPSPEQSLDKTVLDAYASGDQKTLDKVDSDFAAQRDHLRANGARRVIYMDSETVRQNAVDRAHDEAHQEAFDRMSPEDQRDAEARAALAGHQKQIAEDMKRGAGYLNTGAYATEAQALTATGREVQDMPAMPETMNTPEYKERQKAVLDQVDSLILDAHGTVDFTSETRETENGPVTTEVGELEPGILFEVTHDPATGNVIDAIVIAEGSTDGGEVANEGGTHFIESSHIGDTESVSVDDEQPSTEDLEKVEGVVAHLKEVVEQRKQEKAPKKQTEEKAEDLPQEEAQDEEKKSEKKAPPTKGKALNFMKHMMGNRGTRETVIGALKGSGVNPNDFMKSLEGGEVSGVMNEEMKRLFHEYPPNSGIWNESENASSQMGRAAKDAKDRLRKIVRGLGDQNKPQK